MENIIKIFENEEFGRIRTLKEESGKVVFCGSDIAKALGYRNVSDALRIISVDLLRSSPKILKWNLIHHKTAINR